MASRFFVCDSETGERVSELLDGDKIIHRSEKQQEHDRLWSESVAYNGGTFMKQYKRGMQDLLPELRDNPTALYILIYVVTNYLQPETNCLVKNGKRLKVSDIAEDLGVSRQSISPRISLLKELSIIADMEEYGIGVAMHINPSIFMASKTINKRTLDLFSRAKGE